MNLNTHPENRKEMAKAISELLSLEAVYMRLPSYAYRIGDLTVNLDGTITCPDEILAERIKPLLIERGWLDADPEAPVDSKAKAETDSGLTVSRVDITMPVDDWSVGQLTNLIRMLYSKQHLINRMLNHDMLFIDEAFIMELSETPPETPADFEARIQSAAQDGSILGMNIADSKITLSTPFAEDEPTRWAAYGDLLRGILKTARSASRISSKLVVDSENEKYHANSWLMRMGFGGPQHKEMRRILMGHLHGFAAFKSTADMQAHKDKQAQLRADRREAARA